jgi:hypothetical protein
MFRALFYDDYGSIRLWVLAAAGLLITLLVVLLVDTMRAHPLGGCRDSVPGAFDGRCTAGQDLVVEDGVALCRCRKEQRK